LETEGRLQLFAIFSMHVITCSDTTFLFRWYDAFVYCGLYSYTTLPHERKV